MTSITAQPTTGTVLVDSGQIAMTTANGADHITDASLPAGTAYGDDWALTATDLGDGGFHMEAFPEAVWVDLLGPYQDYEPDFDSPEAESEFIGLLFVEEDDPTILVGDPCSIREVGVRVAVEPGIYDVSVMRIGGHRVSLDAFRLSDAEVAEMDAAIEAEDAE